MNEPIAEANSSNIILLRLNNTTLKQQNGYETYKKKLDHPKGLSWQTQKSIGKLNANLGLNNTSINGVHNSIKNLGEK